MFEMKNYFYVVIDCVNLGEKPGKALGKRFSSQERLEEEIASAHHYGTVNSSLPMYVRGMKMVPDTLYRTNKFLNARCCSYHVITTEKPGELESNKYYRFDMDSNMMDEIFGKTDTHDTDCPCVLSDNDNLI
jgi:hypothetical protein